MPTATVTIPVSGTPDEYSPVQTIGPAKEIIYEFQGDVETLPNGAVVEIAVKRPTSGNTGPLASWDAEGMQDPVPVTAWPGPLEIRAKSGDEAANVILHLSWW